MFDLDLDVYSNGYPSIAWLIILLNCSIRRKALVTLIPLEMLPALRYRHVEKRWGESLLSGRQCN